MTSCYRRLFWTDKAECARLVRLAPAHVAPLRLEQWTEPPETDVSVLTAQFRSLVTTLDIVYDRS